MELRLPAWSILVAPPPPPLPSSHFCLFLFSFGQNRIGPAVEPIEPEMDPASTVSAPGDDESDLEDGDSAASVSEDGDFEDDGEFDEFDEDGTEQDGAEQEQEQAAYLTILDGETPAGGDGGVVGSTHPGGDGAPQSETVPN